MIDWPKEPSGSSAEANWFRKLLRKVRSIELKQGAGYRIKPSPNGGFFLDMNSPERASGTSSPGTVKMFKITELPAPEDEGDDFKDYFIAREWDGLDLGTTDFKIAKAVDFRPSMTSRMVGLITYDFVYDSDNTRTATQQGSTTAQSEQIIMPYEVDNSFGLSHPDQTFGIVYAAKVSNGTGVFVGSETVEWIDLTARMWARF